MVVMNLFAGQQWSCRHREETRGHWAKEREGQTERVTLKTHITICKIDSQWE